jgi:pyruvate formate lyase activating enzyme
MSTKGRIFDISKGCVEDGPGLRTVVFLKGCRLDCPWCHNLEGKSFEPQIAWDAARCIGCGLCRKACPRPWPSSPPGAWRRGCTACGRCVDACPSGARRLVGRDIEPRDLVPLVLDDIDFFRGTGGGVTFSGGEPLAQPRFLFAAARDLRRHGLHVAVETSGDWPPRLAGSLARGVDLVIFDLKHVDPRKFREATGRGNGTLLRNLEHLLRSSVDMEIRLTLIPGFNEGEEDLGAIALWLRKRRRIPPVRLIPFHRLAAAKQVPLGRPYPFASAPLLPEDVLLSAKTLLRREGLEVLD